MQKKLRREQALEYHAKVRPGKIEVVPTKEAKTQRDLSLAYSPGVAEPCKEIALNKEQVYTLASIVEEESNTETDNKLIRGINPNSTNTAPAPSGTLPVQPADSPKK